MGMFSVLSTDREQQFVLLNTNYMPAGFDPLEHTGNTFASDALVTIIGWDSTRFLRDTIYARLDTSRYKFPTQAYVASPFVPEYESAYDIMAQSPSLRTATGSTVIPGKAHLSISSLTQAVFRYPTRYSQEALIRLFIQSQGAAKGYVCRMFVYYDVLKGGQWLEERAEIPVSSISGGFTLVDARYPTLTVRPTTGDLTVFFRNGYYMAVVNHVSDYKYPRENLIYKWVVLTFLQVDTNLYEYYNAVHQYRDPLTVRLDEPIYSTVRGGVGLVGSYSLDSLTYVLPGDFYGNH
jgi:hypothetical protein